jgi:hypothetical protein
MPDTPKMSATPATAFSPDAIDEACRSFFGTPWLSYPDAYRDNQRGQMLSALQSADCVRRQEEALLLNSILDNAAFVPPSERAVKESLTAGKVIAEGNYPDRETWARQQFLAGGARFKLTSSRNGAKFDGFPAELSGRWVALVSADNDEHLVQRSGDAPVAISTILFRDDRLPARDADGYFSHPDLDAFCTAHDGVTLRSPDDEGIISDKLLLAVGFESRFIELGDDVDEDHPAYVRYFDAGGTGIHDWAPTVPEGDGWKHVGSWDTEDGPVAMFVRPVANPPADARDAQDAGKFRVLLQLMRDGNACVECVVPSGQPYVPDPTQALNPEELAAHLIKFLPERATGGE